MILNKIVDLINIRDQTDATFDKHLNDFIQKGATLNYAVEQAYLASKERLKSVLNSIELKYPTHIINDQLEKKLKIMRAKLDTARGMLQ